MIKNAEIIDSEVAPESYAADPAKPGDSKLEMRAHYLIEILRNPQRWMRGYQSPESKSKAWGSKLDCLLLTPGKWPFRYTVLPEDAPRKPSIAQRRAKKPSPDTIAAITWWDKFTAENKGEIIDAEEAMEVKAACARMREDKLLCDLLECSETQVLVRAEWHDQTTGLVIPLKCLIDLTPEATHPVYGQSLWDTKTTRNASPRSFSRDAQRYRYDVQAAFYLDMWNAAEPNNQRTDFGHVIVENYPPFEFRSPPPLMSKRFLAVGRTAYQQALGIYCQCLKTGVWPGYTSGTGWPETDCDNWFFETGGLVEQPISEEEEDPFAELQPASVS